jgi:DNA-binding Lrp family transcriptional regulator
MESQIFKIDDVDKSIIELVQDDPSLTHTQIAKKVNRSQPTVGMRIRKLEELGVLKFQAGINLKTADLYLARVELDTLNPSEIEKLVKNCPYMINGFRQSGDFNFSILLIGFQFQHLDKIVNTHFRNNPDVIRVVMNVITDVINDFVLPFNFNFKECSNDCTEGCCGKCCR